MPTKPSPPGDGATKDGVRVVANGNGKTLNLSQLLNGLTLIALVGLFTLLWNMHAQIAVIESTMVTKPELQRTLREEVPAPWFREQVQDIEEKLDEHVEQTAIQGHRGGDP